MFHTAAKEALSRVEIVSDQGAVASDSEPQAAGEAAGNKKGGISDECRDCLSSVGMAAWNCGTFEMDCIKGKYNLKG